jgi:hypothetical protein
VQELQFAQDRVELGGRLGEPCDGRGRVFCELKMAEADPLELAQNAGDFTVFPESPTPGGQLGAEPIGDETKAHIIDDAIRPPV